MTINQHYFYQDINFLLFDGFRKCWLLEAKYVFFQADRIYIYELFTFIVGDIWPRKHYEFESLGVKLTLFWLKLTESKTKIIHNNWIIIEKWKSKG